MNNKTNLALVSFVAAIFATTALVLTPVISNANAIVGGTGTMTTVKVQAGGVIGSRIFATSTLLQKYDRIA